jgi:hypothetical protein
MSAYRTTYRPLQFILRDVHLRRATWMLKNRTSKSSESKLCFKLQMCLVPVT